MPRFFCFPLYTCQIVLFKFLGFAQLYPKLPFIYKVYQFGTIIFIIVKSESQIVWFSEIFLIFYLYVIIV